MRDDRKSRYLDSDEEFHHLVHVIVTLKVELDREIGLCLSGLMRGARAKAKLLRLKIILGQRYSKSSQLRAG